jgi:tRNA(Glu) U13 pseudouridine synthase TruD
MRLLPGASHFEVTELPLYDPTGSGEHLYVWVEKEGADSDQVVELLCAATGRPARDVGYAGRKDRVAVARQWFSVRLGDEGALQRLAVPAGGRIEVLAVSRDREKLRLGQLRGNRFRLGLDPGGGALDSLRESVARLTQCGVENRFGAQRSAPAVRTSRSRARGPAATPRAPWRCASIERRMEARRSPAGGLSAGSDGQRARRAAARPQDAERALGAAGSRFAKLIASSAQSAIFNAVLDARREAGLLYTLRAGDVARAATAGSSAACPRTPRASANARRRGCSRCSRPVRCPGASCTRRARPWPRRSGAGAPPLTSTGASSSAAGRSRAPATGAR